MSIENPSYNIGSIEHPDMAEGGRGLENYEDVFGFRREELEGLSVADLGSGTRLRFENGLRDAGIHADIVNVSPDFQFPEIADKVKAANPEASLVAALGEKLPFPEGTFDRVFALHVLEHIRTSFPDFVLEAARTLKEGGKASLGPTSLDSRGKLKHASYDTLVNDTDLMEKLREMGVSVSKRMLSETETIDDTEATAMSGNRLRKCVIVLSKTARHGQSTSESTSRVL